MASRSVMLITFTGKKSGKAYLTPINYARKGDQVTAFTGAKWWRNSEGGARPHMAISKDAPIAEFENVTAQYPVLRVETAD
jgi:hypothetical protein